MSKEKRLEFVFLSEKTNISSRFEKWVEQRRLTCTIYPKKQSPSIYLESRTSSNDGSKTTQRTTWSMNVSSWKSKTNIWINRAPRSHTKCSTTSSKATGKRLCRIRTTIVESIIWIWMRTNFSSNWSETFQTSSMSTLFLTKSWPTFPFWRIPIAGVCF